MKKIRILIIATVGALSLYSCSLEEMPVTSGDKALVFGSAQGLEAYSLSFYQQLPSPKELRIMGLQKV